MGIRADMTKGPSYGGRTILATDQGTFFIADQGETAEQTMRKPGLFLDGEYSTAVSIEPFGFTLADFKDVELNKFGLKEVAKSGFETLVVTANGLFVQYSGKLPSLQGMPSEVLTVSGVWVDEDGELNAPRLTVYTKTQYASNILVAASTSFREVPTKAISLVHTIITQENIQSDSHVLCTYADENVQPSMYAHLYPTFSKEYADLYDTLMDNSSSLTIRPGQLKPVILPV